MHFAYYVRTFFDIVNAIPGQRLLRWLIGIASKIAKKGTKEMNKYRVYIMNTSDVMAPVAYGAFLTAPTYRDAWQIARGVLRGDAKYAKHTFTEDAEGNEPVKFPSDASNIAQIHDAKPRNVKLDKAALAEMLQSGGDDASETLAKMAAMLGVKIPAK
jgi:hypothetical protein